MIVGFTGGRHTPTVAQARSVERILTNLMRGGFREFHHGCCRGADIIAAKLARKLGYYVIGHPPEERAWCAPDWEQVCDRSLPPRPYLVRNHHIVDAASLLIAAPRDREVLRSGTWSTVRLARTDGILTIIVWPDGQARIDENGTLMHDAPKSSLETS